MRIAFIGPRGAGKSKISRKFAKRIDWLLLSTDTLVCYEAGGKTVKEIVETEGWQGFREREYELLKKLYPMDRIIIDCGGGILFELDPETQNEILSQRKLDLLLPNTFVIYIKRALEWLLEKNIQSAGRPDLSYGDYETMLFRRLPLYEKYASYILDMRNKEIEEALDELHFVIRRKMENRL